MRVREFESKLWLPRPREEVFTFFSDPANLDAITPPWLNFHTVTPGPIELRPDALIDYKLRIHGIPVRWRTRITAWEPPGRFVDEQIRGPYRLWVHEHTFEECDGGTLMRDWFVTPSRSISLRIGWWSAVISNASLPIERSVCSGSLTRLGPLPLEPKTNTTIYPAAL